MDVLHSFSQRRHLDGEDRQPVIQIQAKRTLRCLLLQRLVGGRDQAHVNLCHLISAYPLQLARLQKAQHLGLHSHRHLADLVEQQRSSIGRLDPPHARLHRTGEGAAGVAK